MINPSLISAPTLPPFTTPPIPRHSHPLPHCSAADPSPLKSFSHWPLSSAHPLLTAGSARRNRSSLSLTTLSDLNAASLALHPAPFALLAPATPTSPCRPFSFSTSFTFRISSPNAAGLGGEGLAFVMLPTPTLGLPGPSLGYGRLLLPPGSTTAAAAADDGSSVSSVASSQLSKRAFLPRSLVLLPCCSDVLLICFFPPARPSSTAAPVLRSLTCPVPSNPYPQQQRSLVVEFDTCASPEFWGRQEHHVGVNLDGSMLASSPCLPLHTPLPLSLPNFPHSFHSSSGVWQWSLTQAPLRSSGTGRSTTWG
ncbi:unnamed protein product [Closterium sp. Naga37s-1]|nr:unnamed protein product [Closterium sp. Naga37s-1]